MLRAHFETLVRVSEANKHGAGMKETNVEYRQLYTHTVSVTPSFEMRSNTTVVNGETVWHHALPD
jgi:hypothetical protein